MGPAGSTAVSRSKIRRYSANRWLEVDPTRLIFAPIKLNETHSPLSLYSIHIMLSSTRAFLRASAWFRRLHTFGPYPYVFGNRPYRKFISIVGWSATSWGLSQFALPNANNSWIWQAHFLQQNVTGKIHYPSLICFILKPWGEPLDHYRTNDVGPFSRARLRDPLAPKHRNEFEIAIICALPLEADAVDALFDKYWPEEVYEYGKAAGDPNAYTTGMIGRHNVVLAHMPSMGKVNAGMVAANCRNSFTNIKLALVVGICGGVPVGNDKEEILLGDVIISEGVIQYDFGRQFSDKFDPKKHVLDVLGRPNTEIRSFISMLKVRRSRMMLRDKMSEHLASLCEKLGNAA